MSVRSGGPPVTPEADREPVPTVVVRPLATPLPMSFLALAVASAVFAAVELRWVPPSQGHVAALGALALTAPLQAFACVLGFLARDPVAGTGCALLAGTWTTIGVVTASGAPGSRFPGLGVILVAGALSLGVPVVAGWSKRLAALVMAASAVRFVLTAVYEMDAGTGWREVAGGFGLALSLLALYAALAYELEGVHQRTVLPTWRAGSALRALHDGVHADHGRLTREPGVRDQL